MTQLVKDIAGESLLNITCPICLKIAGDPVKLNCECKDKLYCRLCLKKALEIKPNCPLCRAPSYSNQIQSTQFDNTSLQLLNKQNVHCSYSEDCKWIGLYETLANHVKEVHAIKEEKNSLDGVEWAAFTVEELIFAKIIVEPCCFTHNHSPFYWFSISRQFFQINGHLRSSPHIFADSLQQFTLEVKKRGDQNEIFAFSNRIEKAIRKMGQDEKWKDFHDKKYEFKPLLQLGKPVKKEFRDKYADCELPANLRDTKTGEKIKLSPPFLHLSISLLGMDLPKVYEKSFDGSRLSPMTDLKRGDECTFYISSNCGYYKTDSKQFGLKWNLIAVVRSERDKIPAENIAISDLFN